MSDTDQTHDTTAAEDTRPNEGETGAQLESATQADGTETPPASHGYETARRRTYVTTETLRHDDVDYPPGSPIDLNDERADALLKAGTVKRSEPN